MYVEEFSVIIRIPGHFGNEQKNYASKDQDADEDDDRDMCARVTGFSLANQGSTERTEVGEPPEPWETANHTGGQPGATEAAGDGKAPT